MFSLNDDEVGNDEVMAVVELVGLADTFERLGSGLGTSILSASDLDSRNGFLMS